jgi:hypothetical protein
VFIAADDVRGGTGANFLVGWAASRPIAEPVIEAVMIGNVGTSGYSFAIQGQAIRICGDARGRDGSIRQKLAAGNRCREKQCASMSPASSAASS